MQNFQNNNYVA